MKVLIFYCTINIVIILSSCTEIIKVDIPSEDNRIVIEGRVTNEVDYFCVKIHKTLPIDLVNKYLVFPIVKDAFVTISDNAGNIDTLTYLDGAYYTDTIKIAVVGRTYFLKVVANGITYTAQDKLLPAPVIDSLYTRYMEKGSFFNIIENGYYLFYNSYDPPDENTAGK